MLRAMRIMRRNRDLCDVVDAFSGNDGGDDYYGYNNNYYYDDDDDAGLFCGGGFSFLDLALIILFAAVALYLTAAILMFKFADCGGLDQVVAKKKAEKQSKMAAAMMGGVVAPQQQPQFVPSYPAVAAPATAKPY